MKKYFKIFAALLLIPILLSACQNAPEPSYIPKTAVTNALSEGKTGEARILSENEYVVHSSRANYTDYQSPYFTLKVITTKEEYDCSLLGNVYDEEFFRTKSLVYAYLILSSGSITCRLNKLEITNDNKLRLDILTNSPVAVTCDMSGWTFLIEIDKSLGISNDRQLEYYYGDRKIESGRNVISYGRYHASIDLPKVADNWEYFIEEPISENAPFGISFKPKKEKGKIMVMFYPEGFAFNEKDYLTKEIQLGEYKGIKHTAKDAGIWSFITLPNLAGDYVILNNGADGWLNDVYVKRKEILKNMLLADCTIKKDHATLIATQFDEGYFESSKSTYDYKNGIWTVEMYNGSKPYKTVTLYKTGTTLSSIKH